MKDIIIIGANKTVGCYIFYYRDNLGKKGYLVIKEGEEAGAQILFDICPSMPPYQFAALPLIENKDKCGVKSTLLSS